MAVPIPIAIFLSSPRDVAAERLIVKQAIEDIKADPAWQARCTLRTLAYEDSVPTQMGKSAQRVVDDFMRKSSEADIVICILCSRMGTPTVDEKTGRRYDSGTHYEFDTAYQAFKQRGEVAPRILLFLGSRDLPDRADDEELDQFTKARQFKKRIRSGAEYEGLFVDYKDLGELKKMVSAHLKSHLDQLLAPRRLPSEPLLQAAPPQGLRTYLEGLAESYRWLELQGIREAGTLRIELDKVYVALKAEPESDYDLEQAANLHSVEVQEATGYASLDVIDVKRLEQFDAENIRRTYRPGREEAKRATVTEVRTVGDAFRMYRRIVILGAPGSGKSTLGRWLALQLASTMVRELDTGLPLNVKVPLSRIDPSPSAVQYPEELVDLGPARLPIFLRVAHFSRELTERESDRRPTIALIDYLGRDPDACSLNDGCTPESRNNLLRSFLNAGKAVVILDGLDELSEANRRSVVLKIQDFIERPPIRDALTYAAAPFEVGGNQVVVTSRYVGYKLAPVRAGCAHFGIQSMQRPAVERFAHSWSDAVNAELGTHAGQRVDPDKLIAEVYTDQRPAIRELATNPLLVTILATVYWADGHLPDQRAGLYHQVVENLLRIWLRREECRINSLTREELLAVLEPLAAEMQENTSSNSLIAFDRIGEVVEEPLAHMRGMSPVDRRFRSLRDALLDTIRKHLGLLAEQSPGNYAFFHRTFQEFLAARHLLADRNSAAQKIADRLDDPLWREPLLLALGFAMIDPAWGPEARSRLLADILAADGAGSLIPRAALLIVTALPDLRDVPVSVVEKAGMQLLTSYARSLDQNQAGELRRQIEQAFMRLKDGRHGDAVAQEIARVIRRPPGTVDHAGAAASLLRRIGWLTTEFVDSLLVAIERDRASYDWPIHRALLSALAHRPVAMSWLGQAPHLSLQRLYGHLPMRRLLEGDAELVAWVHKDTDWLWLMIALYGGLGHVELLERLDRLQQARVQKTRDLGNKTATPAAEEPDAELPEQCLMICPVEFSPRDIVHDLADAELSGRVQRHLFARRPARELIPLFGQKWTQGSSPSVCAEALVGLAALGEDVIPLLRAALNQTGRQTAARVAIVRFTWLGKFLQEPLLRTSQALTRTIPEEAPEQHQFDLLMIGLEALLSSGSAPVKVSDRIPECRYVAARTPAVIASLEAEFWSYLFSGATEDGYFEGANTPDAFGRVIKVHADTLIHSWSLVHATRNHRAARRLPWPQPILPPRADSPEERYLAMLDSLASVPGEYEYFAGYLLGRCRLLAEADPILFEETVDLIWMKGPAFWDGFRSADAGFALTARALDALRAEGVPQTSLLKLQTSKNRVFDARELFVREVSAVLDSNEWSAYEDVVLSCARSRGLEDNDPVWRFNAAFPQLGRGIADFSPRWRFPMDLAESHDTLRPDILGLLAKIDDPHAQIRAFERILMAAPGDFSKLWEPVMNIASRIGDPENRARAQCRLAFVASEHRERLLLSAVESIREISDLERRAYTIQEVRAVWGRIAEIQDALNELALTMPDPWQRNKALGRPSRLVQHYRASYSTGPLVWRAPPDTSSDSRRYRRSFTAGSLPWGLVYLATTAAEVEALDAASAAVVGQWYRLLGSERQSAIADLIAAGVEAGVPVAAPEAAILDQIVQLGQGADIASLWPFLERPDAGAFATVTRWAGRHDLAGRWSALVQAEAGRLNPETVTSVVDLLSDSTDRLQQRAALALHGRQPHAENKHRRWSVRRVGIEAVEAVAQRAIEPDCPPAVRTSLNWVHHDLHHDDIKAIERWLAQGAASNNQTTPAWWILGWMESIQSDLVPQILASLASSPPEWQRTLMFGLARVAFCSESLEGHSEAFLSSLSSVPPEVRAGVRVVPAGPVTLLEIAGQALAAPRKDDLVQADRILQEKAIKIDDSCLTDGKQAIKRLNAIGKELYIRVPTYWELLNKAAASLPKSDHILRFLLAWLLSKYEDREHQPRIVPDLLSATEAVASLSPDAFAAVADPRIWEPILTEWARSGDHWTMRLAAIRLLGRLRRVSEGVVLALRSALNDVSFVQIAAYEAACEFRCVESDILSELLALLDDPSASLVAATVRLLVGVSGESNAGDRRRIVRRLQEVAARSSAMRPLYVMEEGLDLTRVRFADRLDRILYRAIFEVSGW